MIGSCEKGGLALFVDIKKVLWETPASLEKTTPPPQRNTTEPRVITTCSGL